MYNQGRKRTASQAGLDDYELPAKRFKSASGKAIPMWSSSQLRKLSSQLPRNKRIQRKLKQPFVTNPSPFGFPNLFAPQSSSHDTSSSQHKPFDFSVFDQQQSVKQMGLWQMSQSRQAQLSKQLPSYIARQSPRSTDIRIKANTGNMEDWGVSADENIRTQIQRDKRSQMTDSEAEMAFNQRSHQGALVWKTNSPTLLMYGDHTDNSEPLSAHTPGLKSLQVKGTKGAKTKEHGTRDTRRGKIVMQTLTDPKRKPSDLAIIGKLATVQLFQSPAEELQTSKLQMQNMPQARFSVFSDIGDITDSHSQNFDKLAQRQQVVRETDKMHIAKNLLIAGRDSLVPATHKHLLSSAQGDVGKAMDLLHQQSISQQPNITFNQHPSSQTTRLDLSSLGQMDTQNQAKAQQNIPLSPVRKIKSPKFTFTD
ncbi:hypothetical protein [Agarivorans sp. Z349TD_8]|uniref:hypothetical protein n=1 Tax=Agarivorans sp. Z349TD_8 TaxID=3421434 RepID=UPI003D7D50BD